MNKLLNTFKTTIRIVKVYGVVLMETGIIMVQHGDFPFEFKENNKDMFDFIKKMLGEISAKTREIHRNAATDVYTCDMNKIERAVGDLGGFKHLEVGYMEFASPTIEEAVEKLMDHGLNKIMVVNSPGLFMRSSHSLIDVPEILGEVKSKYPDLELTYAPPGGFLEEIADIMVKKIDTALGKPYPECEIRPEMPPGDYGVLIVAHGDVPLDYLDKKNMENAEEHVEKWSEMVRNWPRDEENDPLLHDTHLLKEFIKEKGGYGNFEVGNLEFAPPTLEESLEKVLKRGAKRVLFVGGTGFMDRSSHSMVDIPEAVEKLQKIHPEVNMNYLEPDLDIICQDIAVLMVSKLKNSFS